MLSTPYVPDKTLKGQHTSNINCLAFSPQANYLASGGKDSRLIVWDVSSGTVANTVQTFNPVLSLTWDPRRYSTIFFGCENGVAVMLSDFRDPSSARRILTGIRAPVDCLDIEAISGKLAIGIGPEVHIAEALLGEGHYSNVDMMPVPRVIRTADDEEELVRSRSIHLLRGGQKLLVSYLRNGVVCWDLKTRTKLWQIEPTHSHGHIGFSALSPDQRSFIISNLSSGADLYRFGQSTVVQSYPQGLDSTRNYPLTVAFMYKGEAVICGATRGDVLIRQTWSGEHQQTLEHGDHLIQVLCVGQYRSTGFVATAASELGAQTHITIWKAKLNSSICDSFINTTVTSMAFFLHADAREKMTVIKGYIAAIIVALAAILCCYVWDADEGMRFGQTAGSAAVSAISALWEETLKICLTLWYTFLEWLRKQLGCDCLC